MAFWYPNREDVRRPEKTWERREREQRRVAWQSSLQEQPLQALQLQYKWQEVSQRERRAKLRNAQLLQDFQRAEAAVQDLAARSAAICSIRAEYEKQLEQMFPRWQQKLEEKRTYVQRTKQGELNFNDYLGRQEGNTVTQSGCPVGAQSSCSHACHSYLLSSTPPPPPDVKNTYIHTLKNDSMASQSEGYTQNVSDQTWHPMAHNSWLTQGQPGKSVSQTRTVSHQKADASMETRGFQDISGAANPVQQPLPALVSQPFDPCWLFPPTQPLSGWFGLYSAFPPWPLFNPPAGPWQGFHGLDPRADCEPVQDQKSRTCMSFRRRDKDGDCGRGPPQEAGRGLRQRQLDRQEKPGEKSLELDVKPGEDSSESSSTCTGAQSGRTPASPRKKEKGKRGRLQRICTDLMRTFCHRSDDGVASSMETLSGHMGHSPKTSGHSVTAKRRSSESSPNEGETASAQSSAQAEKDGLTQEGAVESPEMGIDLGEREETSNGEKRETESSSQAEEEDDEEEESEECSKEEESSGEEESEEDEEMDGCEGNGEKGEPGEEDEVGGASEEEATTSEGSTEVGETDRSEQEQEEETSGHEEFRESQGPVPKGAEGEKTVEEQEQVADEGNGLRGEEEDDDSPEGGYSEDDSEEEGNMEEERQREVNPEEGDGEQDEQDGTGSLKGSEDEDEVREDFSQDEEEINEEEGGSGVEEMGVTDSKKDESEGMTDSDEEIICSPLDDRASQALRDGGNIMGRSEAAEKMRKTDEEDEEDEEEGGGLEYQQSAGDDSSNSDGADHGYALSKKVITGDEDGQCSDDEEDIEALLAPHGLPERLQAPEVVAQEEPGHAPVLDKEPKDTLSCDPPREKKPPPAVKTKAPWRDSESDSDDTMRDREELCACDAGGQDDFDDFYD